MADAKQTSISFVGLRHMRASMTELSSRGVAASKC